MEPADGPVVARRPQISGDAAAVDTGVSRPQTHAIEQCAVPAQTFQMGDPFGDGKPGDGEHFVHDVTLREFTIDATAVTNADFAAFVDATGYRTEAERYEFSAVFHLSIAAPRTDVLEPVRGTPWWHGVRGADWRHPGGRLSDLDGLNDHPVVHVSWNDAMAYCRWASRRLPTEAEWECAARGGAHGQRFPWGNELLSGLGRWQCNIWQGDFPRHNTLADGWLTTAPARSFRPNGYGLWQAVGNVWEWCSDWFSAEAYLSHDPLNPRGPARGTGRVLRGGSFLCHDSYCNRYRSAARSSNTADSSMSNSGFRTVALPAD
ncbi:formylglycine-generating enzyme family protein [Glaciibacter psychrotolerans]